MAHPAPSAKVAQADAFRKGVEDQSTEEGTSEGIEDFKPLSRDEAQQLRQAKPGLSLWAVVAAQAMVGGLMLAAAWLLTSRANVAWSTGYGALAVVLPAALFARGLSRQKRQKRGEALAHGSASLTGFFVWEMVKIALTVAMLVVAPRLIKDVSWLALLAGFVVTMKVYWVAMWFRPAPKPSVEKL